jgi:AhpD family alkylhydroperoxidase
MERLQFWRLNNDAIRELRSAAAHLGRSGLDIGLLDLVYLRVSQLNRCSYCVDAYAQQAIAHGVDQRIVDGVAAWREAPFFSQRERAAFEWVEAVTDISKTGAPDDIYRETVREFSETELVDLTLAIALMNAFARIAVAFRHGPPPMPIRIEGAVQ